LLKAGIEFISLYRLLRNQKIEHKKNLALVDIDKDVAPFSFFNYIVYNSRLYNETELENILNHEEVHSRQKHSLDILFAKFMCIAFWFNPLVWIYKKIMIQNLEYIADQEAIKKTEDKRAYQLALLKVVTHQNCFSVTNNFYQSLIKKRIVMLNKDQSKKTSSWKYLLVFPVLAAFVVCFQVKVIAQKRQQESGRALQRGVEVVVGKNTSDAEMKSDAEKLKKEHGIALKFSKVKRNRQGEIIAIKAQYEDLSGKKGTTQVSGDEPIRPIRFYKNSSGAIGFSTENINTAMAGNAKKDEGYVYSYNISGDAEAPKKSKANKTLKDADTEDRNETSGANAADGNDGDNAADDCHCPNEEAETRLLNAVNKATDGKTALAKVNGKVIDANKDGADKSKTKFVKILNADNEVVGYRTKSAGTTTITSHYDYGKAINTKASKNNKSSEITVTTTTNGANSKTTVILPNGKVVYGSRVEVKTDADGKTIITADGEAVTY
ncbi:MAG TPA: M56 family metallopeptidase, partial [Flavobacterium sp.]|nr:M56 family metallopeptidase [Flavobacterium sp.]